MTMHIPVPKQFWLGEPNTTSDLISNGALTMAGNIGFCPIIGCNMSAEF
jgi:hypothetical protein